MAQYTRICVQATIHGPDPIKLLNEGPNGLYFSAFFNPGTKIPAVISSAPKKVHVPATSPGVDLDWIFTKWVTRTLHSDGTHSDVVVKYKPDPSIPTELPVPSPNIEIGDEDIILYAVYFEKGGPVDDDPAVVLSAYDLQDVMTVLVSTSTFFEVSRFKPPLHTLLDTTHLNLEGGFRVLVTKEVDVDITRHESVTDEDAKLIYTFSHWEVLGENSEPDNGVKISEKLSYKQFESPVVEAYYSVQSTEKESIIHTHIPRNIPMAKITILFGVTADGGGIARRPGGPFFRIPPRSPALEFFKHLATLETHTHETHRFLDRLEDVIRQVTRRFNE